MSCKNNKITALYKVFECVVELSSCLQPPQMSNCVNQRMEFRVFERVADRDYSPRVMAVRRVSSIQFGPFSTIPLPNVPSNCDIIVIFGKAPPLMHVYD